MTAHNGERATTVMAFGIEVKENSHVCITERGGHSGLFWTILCNFKGSMVLIKDNIYQCHRVGFIKKCLPIFAWIYFEYDLIFVWRVYTFIANLVEVFVGVSNVQSNGILSRNSPWIVNCNKQDATTKCIKLSNFFHCGGGVKFAWGHLRMVPWSLRSNI